MTSVLVVDDDPAIQRTLAIGLRARGYDVLPALDGRTAVVDLAALGAHLAARKAELMSEMSEGMEVVG